VHHHKPDLGSFGRNLHGDLLGVSAWGRDARPATAAGCSTAARKT
jgi:hypothetical protein